MLKCLKTEVAIEIEAEAVDQDVMTEVVEIKEEVIDVRQVPEVTLATETTGEVLLANLQTEETEEVLQVNLETEVKEDVQIVVQNQDVQAVQTLSHQRQVLTDQDVQDDNF
jgi:hypothetical protein